MLYTDNHRRRRQQICVCRLVLILLLFLFFFLLLTVVFTPFYVRTTYWPWKSIRSHVRRTMRDLKRSGLGKENRQSVIQFIIIVVLSSFSQTKTRDPELTKNRYKCINPNKTTHELVKKLLSALIFKQAN